MQVRNIYTHSSHWLRTARTDFSTLFPSPCLHLLKKPDVQRQPKAQHQQLCRKPHWTPILCLKTRPSNSIHVEKIKRLFSGIPAPYGYKVPASLRSERTLNAMPRDWSTCLWEIKEILSIFSETYISGTETD